MWPFENARKSAAKISLETGRRVIPLQLDVRFEDEVEKAVNTVLSEFDK